LNKTKKNPDPNNISIPPGKEKVKKKISEIKYIQKE